MTSLKTVLPFMVAALSALSMCLGFISMGPAYAASRVIPWILAILMVGIIGAVLRRRRRQKSER